MLMDQSTVDYIVSLPAVLDATPDRITYADDFKRRVADGCRRGESPVAMFREAGLGPELIGYKRIERCVARWRHLDAEPSAEVPGVVDADLAPVPMGVFLAQEARINSLETRLRRVTEELKRLGVVA